jgi:hypothetical protein
MVRLMIADLVGEPVTRASIVSLRDDLADLLAASSYSKLTPSSSRTARSTFG